MRAIPFNIETNTVSTAFLHFPLTTEVRTYVSRTGPPVQLA